MYVSGTVGRPTRFSSFRLMELLANMWSTSSSLSNVRRYLVFSVTMLLNVVLVMRLLVSCRSSTIFSSTCRPTNPWVELKEMLPLLLRYRSCKHKKRRNRMIDTFDVQQKQQQ